MKKCTLCVDRIYDETLPEPERQPACVLACPTHARFFGDFDDPGVEGVDADGGARRLRPAAGARLRAGEPLPAAARRRPSRRRRAAPSTGGAAPR